VKYSDNLPELIAVFGLNLRLFPAVTSSFGET